MVLKIGARVMLSNIIDINNRLINEQNGVVKYLTSAVGKIIKIYVFFDNNQAGLRAMSHDNLSQRHQ